MKAKFGSHYMADLYFCQNKLWENLELLENSLKKNSDIIEGERVSWRFDCFDSTVIRITGDINEYNFLMIQIFPKMSFLAVDIFGWQSQLDLQIFSEELINIFAPQVVAAETKLRAEHLQNQLSVEN